MTGPETSREAASRVNDQSAAAVGERARNGSRSSAGMGCPGADRASFVHARLAGCRNLAGTWYSLVKHSISDLQAVTAPHAWFPITCFAIGGLGTFAFATFGLRPALSAAGTTAAYAPWLLALAALALGNSFPQIPCRLADPGCSAHYQLHSPAE